METKSEVLKDGSNEFKKREQQTLFYYTTFANANNFNGMYQVASLVASPFVFIEIIISITIGLCLCYYSALISLLVPSLVLLFGQDIKITFFL
ncbi:8982_t:CDS:2, partial [Gigaspora rosea]